MKKTTVYLPDALKARVERVAQERRMSEAEVIRTALEKFTDGDVPPRPTLPLFRSLGEPIADRVDEILAEGFGQD